VCQGGAACIVGKLSCDGSSSSDAGTGHLHTGVILQMKAMCIPDVRDFPYPTPPDEADVDRAIKVPPTLSALAVGCCQQALGKLPRGVALGKLPRGVILADAQTLVRLGGLNDDGEEITPLGRALAAFPLAPRFSKMLVLGDQGGCLALVIAMVAALRLVSPAATCACFDHAVELP
jgi:ATP-dependent RNA helicase DHX37/DHR1